VTEVRRVKGPTKETESPNLHCQRILD
jgi:hypothetical protein